jgi:hypothetical protein
VCSGPGHTAAAVLQHSPCDDIQRETINRTPDVNRRI